MTYIPHSQNNIKEMFDKLNISNIDELFSYIPENILNPELNINNSQNEITLFQEIKTIADKNTYNKYSSFLGAGAYNHYIPAVVNEIISRNEFYTAYTPYQPEMSQGILQALFEFQTMICEITGVNVSNTSMYDAPTALCEAILMAVRSTKRNKVLILDPINPLYKKVIQTYANFADIKLDFIDQMYLLENNADKDTSAIVSQYPNFFGQIIDQSKIGEIAKENKSVFISCVNPISLGLFETPANMGAEIIVGEGQPLGIPLSFGGPYLGFLCAKQKFLRQMPGRIVGQTLDKNEKTGYVLTMQTREQHIRREKATSNICSNQALMALAATVYMAYMGKTGLNEIAKICFNKTLELKQKLSKIKNIKINKQNINFNEFIIELPITAKEFIKKAMDKNIIPGYDLANYDDKYKNHLLIAVTEKTSEEETNDLFEFLTTI